MTARILNKNILNPTYFYEINYESFRDDYAFFEESWSNKLLTVYDNIYRMHTENDGEVINTYFDILTIRDFYKQRLECFNKIRDYVKIKTIDYVNIVFNELNDEENLFKLHLYLTINCMICNIEATAEEMLFTTKAIKYDEYPEYSEKLVISNNILYSKIINYIQKW